MAGVMFIMIATVIYSLGHGLCGHCEDQATHAITSSGSSNSISSSISTTKVSGG